MDPIVVPAIVYATGFVLNTVKTMDQNGSDEMETYRKNVEFQKEQAHRSEYAAYWTGCRTGLFYGIVDSTIWPVKFTTFMIYLWRKNTKS